MTQTGSLIQRCPHGVYLAGESTARYCTGCNPEPRRITTIKRRFKDRPETSTDDLDCSQFMELSVGERLTAQPEERV